ncbi:MAG: Uncharacterised protein [Chloroflexota bacterium]|mgnify:CR=1 FL=1|nr:MAG: Uncharacterised protein [Chloroflexota bacterium]|tara:strand:- start:5215 stop:5346 length:132 start_codon:yes stop_codon:yes gene_type:complete
MDKPIIAAFNLAVILIPLGWMRRKINIDQNKSGQVIEPDKEEK